MVKETTTPTKDFIFEAMVKYYKTCGCDRYGQIGTIDIYSVFDNRTKEVIEYLKTDRLIKTCIFGGRFGTYEGFSPWDINDPELKHVCQIAFRNNPSRNNMNQW
jgi:hypothetical protein